MLMGKLRVNAKDSIRQAAEKLRDAKGNEARSEAEKELRDLLEQYFDDDLQRRQAELGEMEDRLAKLEKQLDRRESKKDEIVDLQVKVLVNQAEGLGFFTDMPGDGAGWNVSGQSIVVPGQELKIKTHAGGGGGSAWYWAPTKTEPDGAQPKPAPPRRPVVPPRAPEPTVPAEAAAPAESAEPLAAPTRIEAEPARIEAAPVQR
jgi:hypothetical protein